VGGLLRSPMRASAKSLTATPAGGGAFGAVRTAGFLASHPAAPE
jgi:hypothetical protein